MKIFIDTASVKEIKECRPDDQVLKEICSLVSGPVSAEAINTDSAGMINEARQLIKHSLADIGINRFLEDYKKISPK